MYYRYYFLVFSFVFLMFILIMSPNLGFMGRILLGWDGLGLVSYYLFDFYQNDKSSSAGMLTASLNLLGDVVLMILTAWMMGYVSWCFYSFLDFYLFDFSMIFIILLLSISAFTKSAHIPFSSWLQAAIVAPSPVSSLVHSSTLVTAGVYLTIRFNEFLNMNYVSILLFFSVWTMFMAGLSANLEHHLKKKSFINITTVSTYNKNFIFSWLFIMFFSSSSSCFFLSISSYMCWLFNS